MKKLLHTSDGTDTCRVCNTLLILNFALFCMLFIGMPFCGGLPAGWQRFICSANSADSPVAPHGSTLPFLYYLPFNYALL